MFLFLQVYFFAMVFPPGERDALVHLACSCYANPKEGTYFVVPGSFGFNACIDATRRSGPLLLSYPAVNDDSKTTRNVWNARIGRLLRLSN
jgi:hypothetical protein